MKGYILTVAPSALQRGKKPHPGRNVTVPQAFDVTNDLYAIEAKTVRPFPHEELSFRVTVAAVPPTDTPVYDADLLRRQ